MVGNDVVQMLREACHRRGDIDVDVVAVLNDTTGTLVRFILVKSQTISQK